VPRAAVLPAAALAIVEAAAGPPASALAVGTPATAMLTRAEIALATVLAVPLVAAAVAPVTDPIAIHVSATPPTRLADREFGLATLRYVPLGAWERRPYQATVHRAIVLTRVLQFGGFQLSEFWSAVERQRGLGRRVRWRRRNGRQFRHVWHVWHIGQVG
jgi:uncharacterized RDD family membrane protein YckC